MAQHSSRVERTFTGKPLPPSVVIAQTRLKLALQAFELAEYKSGQDFPDPNKGRGWLAEQLAGGATYKGLGRSVGCTEVDVSSVVAYWELTPPPRPTKAATLDNDQLKLLVAAEVDQWLGKFESHLSESLKGHLRPFIREVVNEVLEERLGGI